MNKDDPTRRISKLGRQIHLYRAIYQSAAHEDHVTLLDRKRAKKELREHLGRIAGAAYRQIEKWLQVIER